MTEPDFLRFLHRVFPGEIICFQHIPNVDAVKYEIGYKHPKVLVTTGNFVAAVRSDLSDANLPEWRAFLLDEIERQAKAKDWWVTK